MFHWACCGLCIITKLTLDNAEIGLIPGAVNTPSAKRHINFSWCLLD
jgi:hypothetical protein